MKCHGAETALAAYVDGDANMLQSHSMKRHLHECSECAAAHRDLLAFRAGFRAEVPRFSAPPALRARVLAMLEASRQSAPAAMPARMPARSGRSRPGWLSGSRGSLGSKGSMGAGALVSHWQWLTGGAVAGCAATLFAWMIGTTVLDWRAGQDLVAEAVTSHVRATLGNQLIQVASSNQHTVKPWLSARLDYSPPVQDLSQEGFPLTGGRVDYLDRHPVATLVYRFRDHNIDVFVRPESSHPPPAPRTVRGFNVASAKGSGMEWIGVSDVSADVLANFVQRLAGEVPTP